MKKVSCTLEFSAQMLSKLCQQQKMASCAIVTSLKDTKLIFSFCESLCEEMSKSGPKTTLVRADGQECPSGDGNLLMVFAPHPDQNMNSFRACSQCDGVVFVEQYGVTRHKDVDEIIEFLRNQNIHLLGVISLDD